MKNDANDEVDNENVPTIDEHDSPVEDSEYGSANDGVDDEDVPANDEVDDDNVIILEVDLYV